jgi:hypothetical protein
MFPDSSGSQLQIRDASSIAPMLDSGLKLGLHTSQRFAMLIERPANVTPQDDRQPATLMPSSREPSGTWRMPPATPLRCSSRRA